MILEEIIAALERFAPLPLQEDYDNAGLQIGLTDAEVTGALLCLDVTEAVIDEALELDCNVIVAHHPLIFRGCKSITDSDYVGRCIRKAIRHNIAIYAAHTNLDNVEGGVSYRMAEWLNLQHVEPLDPVSGSGVIGFLPQPMSPEEVLRETKNMYRAGSVRYNDYSGTQIRRVAMCGGSGSFLIPQAIKAGAQMFLTGEIKYHEYFGHEDDLLLVEIGHYESEQYTRDLLYKILKKAFPELPLFVCTTNTNPIKYL
jgi:dinuclear metal center YbgI/SA1388 family protein